MTNPSYESMERARKEKRASLLDMRRERVLKTLDGLTLHGDSHTMLSQIAYAIHPHVGAWDAESCDHLRNVLAELIGGDHEGASGAQHVCACSVGGCDRGDEPEEVGDLSHDSSLTGQENETGITDKPDDDERYVLDVSKATTIGYEPDALVITNGKDEVRITNGDMIIDGISVVDALNEVANGRLPDFARSNPVTVDYMQREIMELRKVHDELLDLLRDARDEYQMLDRMSAETSANFHAMRDRVWGLEAERDELQGTIADLNEQLERRKAKCLRYKTHIDQMQGGSKRLREKLREQEGTYLDLLRDAAKDYKVLRDKLYHVVKVCQSYTEAKDA